jgi:hypothetical protein
MRTGRTVLLVLVLVAVAAGGSALAGAGQRDPAAAKPRGAFAERLAAELSLPPAQVRAALKAVRRDRRAKRAARRAGRAQQRKHATTRAERRRLRAGRRAERRRHRAERRLLRGRAPGLRPLRRLIRVRDRLAAPLAAELHRSPADVTAALRRLLVARLDRAVTRGRLSADGRAAALACFDDASKCHGLRARLRRP